MPRVPSGLELDRLKLLNSLGLRSEQAPPCWRDDHDPSGTLKAMRTRKQSAQVGHATSIAKPVKTQTKATIYGTAPSFLDTVTAHQGEYPGPGQYYLDDMASRLSGGKFSTANPKSEVDEKIYKAEREPGPGSYETVLTNRGLPMRSGGESGKMSTSKRETELDVLQARARKTPGPGANGAVDGPRPHLGVKFQLANVPSELDMIMKSSGKSPAPHDYGYPDLARQQARRGGEFSTAFPPSALESVIRSKKGIPGPASYSPKQPWGPYVGKVPMERCPSEQDRQVAAARKIPGPGQYELGSTLVDTNPGQSQWPQVKPRPDPKPKGKFVVPEPYVKVPANRRIGLKGIKSRDELRAERGDNPPLSPIQKAGVGAVQK